MAGSQPLNYFCLFLGYQQSGHSVIGSLLDAHPEVVLSHELNILKLVEEAIGQEELFKLIFRNSRWQVTRKRESYGYHYDVPGQWQGRCRHLRVIGDKAGGMSAARLSKKPELDAQLAELTGLEPRYVHIMRNPYDNVASISQRLDRTLEEASNVYLTQIQCVGRIKERIGPERIIDLRHEDLIAEPQAFLKKLTAFLGLEASEDYLEGCASILFKKPQKKRELSQWTKDELGRIRWIMRSAPWLEGYTFED